MYRIDAEEKLQQITIVSAPHLDKADVTEVIDSYRRQASDIIILTTEDNDYSNLSKLKRRMKG